MGLTITGVRGRGGNTDPVPSASESERFTAIPLRLKADGTPAVLLEEWADRSARAEEGELFMANRAQPPIAPAAPLAAAEVEFVPAAQPVPPEIEVEMDLVGVGFATAPASINTDLLVDSPSPYAKPVTVDWTDNGDGTVTITHDVWEVTYPPGTTTASHRMLFHAGERLLSGQVG